MLGNTPMMMQYKKIKQEHPDALLFFRLGDFYEMFGEDAELASRELQITLTGRDAGMNKRVPMCGVPYHAVDIYLSRLIQKGYKVAICEQVEDPKLVKGIVKREVVRIITPGTACDGQLISDSSRNYLSAVYYEDEKWGLAFGDFSTGQFWFTCFSGNDAHQKLINELLRITPSELLINELQTSLINTKFDFSTTIISNDHFNYPIPRTAFSEEIAHCEHTCALAAAAIYSYLIHTQKAEPLQINNFKRYMHDFYLQIDSTTFRNLEIIRTLRNNERNGSLLDTLDFTKTAQGRRLLRSWLEQPLTDQTLIEERYEALEALIADWSERSKLRKALTNVYDIDRLLTRILYQRANPQEIISFKNSLANLPSIKNSLSVLINSPLLNRLFEQFDSLEDIFQLIDLAIEESAPANISAGGSIRKTFDSDLHELYTLQKDSQSLLAQLENKEKDKSGIKSLKIGFNKVFGYYIEVSKSNISLVPDHFIRKQTLANGERYVTEELISLENKILSAEGKIRTLENQIFKELLCKIGAARLRIQNVNTVLAELDVLQSLAEAAVKNGYHRPCLLKMDEDTLFFEDLRHPVIENIFTESPFVPNDLKMPVEEILAIITGPNMGGKSTFCRSAALAVIMAQAGSFVPAKSAIIAIKDKIFARVGANDDLSSGQSTFMVEMSEVANILKNATKYSLIILDEVGRGTSTYDGISLAWAVSEYILNVLKSKTLFATHYHELTQLENLFPTAKNISVSVHERREEIIFLHKIVPGPADKSYGLHVGRLAGLPQSVSARANEILSDLEVGRLQQKTQLRENNLEIAEQKHEYLQDNHENFIKQVLNFDPDQITPLEALNLIYKLHELAKRYWKDLKGS